MFAGVMRMDVDGGAEVLEEMLIAALDEGGEGSSWGVDGCGGEG